MITFGNLGLLSDCYNRTIFEKSEFKKKDKNEVGVTGTILVSIGHIRPFKVTWNSEYSIFIVNRPQEGENSNQKIMKMSFSEESYY